MSVTKENWSGSVRCYHPEMHAAEISVARELARLAAAPQLNISASKVDLWINKNEEKTSRVPSHVINPSHQERAFQ